MDSIFEILKYVLPSGIVFATSFYLIKQFLDNEYKKKLIEIRSANQKIITPIRLQAYERLALLLERINPDSMVIRIHKSNMSAQEMQLKLITTIREEFEHNLSQQVYVSDQSWELVKHAKEETIKLVNMAMSRLSDNATGRELSAILFEIITKVDKLPTVVACEYLKREVRQYF